MLNGATGLPCVALHFIGYSKHVFCFVLEDMLWFRKSLALCFVASKIFSISIFMGLVILGSFIYL